MNDLHTLGVAELAAAIADKKTSAVEAAQHLLARCRDRSARHDWFDAVGDCRKAAELEPKAVEPQVELMRLFGAKR